jgi:hypothetical protein
MVVAVCGCRFPRHEPVADKFGDTLQLWGHLNCTGPHPATVTATATATATHTQSVTPRWTVGPAIAVARKKGVHAVTSCRGGSRPTEPVQGARRGNNSEAVHFETSLIWRLQVLLLPVKRPDRVSRSKRSGQRSGQIWSLLKYCCNLVILQLVNLVTDLVTSGQAIFIIPMGLSLVILCGQIATRSKIHKFFL